MTPIKIMLVDDDPWVRRGLRPMLDSVSRLKVVAEARGAEEALQYLRSNPDINVAIVDIQIHGDTNGIQLTKQIRTEFSHVAVLIFTNADQEEYVREATQAGARNYLLKETDGREIVSAIENLVDNPPDGVPPLPPDSPLRKLTCSEREVLWLMGDSLSHKKIALVRGTALNNINKIATNIWQKIGLKNAHQPFEKLKIAIPYRKSHNNPVEIFRLAIAINWHMFKIGLLKFLTSRAENVRTHGKVDNVSPEAKTALFQVAQEALNNVKQLVHRGYVSVKLDSEDSKRVELTVEYEGDEFNVAHKKSDQNRGFNIRNMQARVEAMDGKLTITSSSQVTTVTATIPHHQCDPKQEKDE
ncbi:response regulator [Nitrosococcus watsonii]|nr:response regulator transcription factor [Nitrosococcus watsonii]